MEAKINAFFKLDGSFEKNLTHSENYLITKVDAIMKSYEIVESNSGYKWRSAW